MRDTVCVNINTIKNASGDLEDIYHLLKECDTKLSSVKNSLQGSQYGQIIKAIESVVDENRQNYIIADKLTEVLLEIANAYRRTENKIVRTKILSRKASRTGKDTHDFDKKTASSTVNTDENTFTYVDENGKEIVFHIGNPTQPQFTYDNDFPYDPDATPTWEDYCNWVKWKVLNEGAEHGGCILNRDMPDAIEAYEHYRSGEGTDLKIDYQKAYEEDPNIKITVDGYINDTQYLVEQMIESGQQCPFSISSELMPVGDEYYPSTENWQKTIGAHQVWISADVTVDENGNVHMDTTVHEIDRYNFNKGMQDIASGASDNENGRFEELGWAKSFTTTGEANFDVNWSKGCIDESTNQNVSESNGRNGIRDRNRNRDRIERDSR